MVKISFRTALQGNTRPNVCFVLLFKCFVVVDVMLFCIVTFNLWLHYSKLLTYLLTPHHQVHRGHHKIMSYHSVILLQHLFYILLPLAAYQCH